MSLSDNTAKLQAIRDVLLGDSDLREQVRQLSAEMDIPKVFIDGTIPTTKDNVLAEMTYISKAETFHAYLKIKCQGSSSMSYPKKNFTVSLYSDEMRETKLKKVFGDWGVESSKFVLKANYIDHSHARNIVCANLWDEVVSSRADYDTLPAELRNSPRNGAIDGFPIKVYTNGTYQGIYTWNIGKDAWMWGMNEDNPNHVLLCAETNTDGVFAETPCNFRTLWDGTDGNYWSVEVGTNSDALKSSLNNLISCVKDTDDATFKATIGNHLDVQSAIDYYIHMYVICGLDGLAKNMLLGTYDGARWICGAYDMDSTFGLWWNGTRFVSTEYRCPEDYQEPFSLLFERIASLFQEEIVDRYAKLRTLVYSFSNVCTKFERFVDIIGKDLYAEDLDIFPEIPSGDTNNIKQIRDYTRDRLAYVDGLLKNIESIEGYTIVEYIESDGNQYIDTGISGGTRASYEIKLSATGTNRDVYDTYFGGANGENVPKIQCMDTIVVGQLNAWGSSFCVLWVGATDTSPHIVRYDRTGSMYADDTEAVFDVPKEQWSDTGWGELSWYVFNSHAEPGLMAAMRLYYLKMYTDDVLVRDFVPVRRDSDGVYGLYDRVSETFFGNLGSGEFTSYIGNSNNHNIDYTLNPISDVSWYDGMVYNNTTGNLTEFEGEHCTTKFSLQDCVYEFNFTEAGSYGALFVWDENGVYIGSFENGSQNQYFTAKSNYQYAIKVNQPESFEPSLISLLPVDNSDTKASKTILNLSELNWTSLDTCVEAAIENVFTGGTAETPLTTNVINSADALMILFDQSHNSPWILGSSNAPMLCSIVVAYGYVYLRIYNFGGDIDAANTYFTNNNTTITFNC